MANDFVAVIQAELDTKQLRGQIDQVTKKGNKLTNFSIDVSSLSKELAQAFSNMKPVKIEIDDSSVKKFTEALGKASDTITGFSDKIGAINKALAEIRGGSNPFSGVASDADKAGGSIDKARQSADDLLSVFRQLANTSNASDGIKRMLDTGAIEKQIAKVRASFEQLEAEFDRLGSKGDAKYMPVFKGIEQIEQLFDALKNQVSMGFSDKSIVNTFNQLNFLLERTRNFLQIISSEAKEFTSATDAMALSNKMSQWLATNTDAAEKYGDAIKYLIDDLDNLLKYGTNQEGLINTSAIKYIEAQFKEISQMATKEGLAGNTIDRIAKQIETGSIDKAISKITTSFDKLKAAGATSGLDSIKNQINEINRLYATLFDQAGTPDSVGTFEKLSTAILNVSNSLTIAANESKRFASAANISAFGSSMTVWLRNNQDAVEKYGSAVQTLQDKLERLGTVNVPIADFEKLKQDFEMITTSAAAEGLTGNAMTEAIKQVQNVVENGGLEASIEKIKAQFESLGTSSSAGMAEIRSNLADLKDFLDILGSEKGTAQSVETFRMFNALLEETRNKLSVIESENKQFATSLDVTNLSNKMTDWVNKNKDAVDKYGESVRQLQERLAGLGTKVPRSQFDAIAEGFKQINADAKSEGLLGSELTNKINSIGQTLDTNGIAPKIQGIIAQFEKLGGAGNTNLSVVNENIQKLWQLFGQLQTERQAFETTGQGGEQLVQTYDELNKVLEKCKNDLKEIQAEQKASASAMEVKTLESQMTQWLRNNSMIGGEYADKIAALRTELMQLAGSGKLTASELQRIKDTFKSLSLEATASGKSVNAFGKSVRTAFQQLTGLYSIYALIRRGMQLFKKMAEEIMLVDTAMTGLKRVTNLTTDEYDALYTKMIGDAKQYGAALNEIIDSTTTWVKLGFDADVAEELGNITTMYQHVTDLDTDTAVKNLVTAYKGFQDELLELTGGDAAASVEYVADIFDKLNNEFAVTAADIGQGLTTCASALQVAGNTIQESSAMLTGITETTQNASKAGAALRMLSMRLRGTTAKELEDIGEDSEGLIEVTAKLQKTIMDLTGGAVSITDVNGQFRSTYDIMSDIADIWDSLESNTQANLLETIAGKNRASDVAALIRNWDQVEKAVVAANEAMGTAAGEQEIFMDSLEGKVTTFKASWQALANTMIDSDFLKGAVDLGTSLVDVFDKLVSTLGTIPTLTGAIAAGFSAIKGKGVVDSMLLPFLSKKYGATSAVGGAITKYQNALISDADIAAITAYNHEIKANIDATEAFNHTMTNASMAARDLVVNANGATVATDGLGTSSKIASVAVKGLSIAMNTLVSMGIALAVQLAVTAISKAINYYDDLHKKVQEVTNEYQSQSKTLRENRKTFDDLSARFVELAKGSNNLGENVSLTTAEYKEFKDVSNQIAEMCPSLVSGYDAQGNAIIRVTETVEGLAAAYDDLIITQNNAMINSGKDIFKDWNKVKSDSTDKEIELLQRLLGASEDELDSILYGGIYDADIYNAQSKIVDALVKAGLKIGFADSPQTFIKDAVVQNREVVKQILDGLYTDVQNEISSVSQLTSAYVQNAILSPETDYPNISKGIENLISKVVSSFDYDFYSQFDSAEALYQYLDSMLAKFNSLSAEQQGAISLVFELQTNFNNGECTVGEYLDAAASAQAAIASFPDELQKYITVFFGIDTEGGDDVQNMYDAIMTRYNNAETPAMSEDAFSGMLRSLNGTELQMAFDISAEPGNFELNEEEWRQAIENKLASPMEVEASEKISFSEMAVSEEFDKTVDDYLDRTEKLKTAIKDMEDGKLGLEDFNTQFPELASASEVEALGKANEALETANANMQTYFDEKRPYVTDDDIATFDNYTSAIMANGSAIGTETEQLNKLKAEMEEIGKLSSFISDAENEAAKNGSNSVTTLSNLIDIVGDDYEKYVDWNEEGTEFTIDTEALKQKKRDEIEAEFGEGTPMTIKLEAELDAEVGTETFEEKVVKKAEEAAGIAEKLAQVENGKALSNQEKIGLAFDYDEFANASSDAEGLNNILENLRDEMNAEFDAAEDKGIDVTALRNYFNAICDGADTATDAVTTFTDTLSNISKVSDILNKAKAGNMGVIDVLESAAEVAKLSGESIGTYFTLTDEGIELNQSAIQSYRDTLISSLNLDSGQQAQLDNLLQQEQAYNDLTTAISNVGKAEELITDANAELASTGKNSIDTLSSLMEMYGTEWQDFTKLNAEGEIIVDTDKVKDDMLSAIDELENIDEETKIKVKAQLGLEIDESSFDAQFDVFKDKFDELATALEKVQGEGLSDDEKLELYLDFPELRGSENLEEDITAMMQDIGAGTGDIVSMIDAEIIKAGEEGNTTYQAFLEGRKQIWLDYYESTMAGIAEVDSSIMNDSAFTGHIDEQIDDIQKLRNAIESIGAGNMKPEDMWELYKDFPELIGKINLEDPVASAAAMNEQIANIIGQQGDLDAGLREAYAEYKAIEADFASLDIDPTQTVFGNIDTNNRQVIEWTDEMMETYRDELESWYKDTDDWDWSQFKKNFEGSVSTVIGSSEEFDGVEIAFSPMLQTDHGAVLLDRDTVSTYINSLIGQLGEGWTTEDLLALDTEGLMVDGQLIKGLIADVGETAIQTGEAMHYMGDNGALAESWRNVEAAAKEAGLTIEEIADLDSYITAHDSTGLEKFFQDMLDSADTEEQRAEIQALHDEVMGLATDMAQATENMTFGDFLADSNFSGAIDAIVNDYTKLQDLMTQLGSEDFNLAENGAALDEVMRAFPEYFEGIDTSNLEEVKQVINDIITDLSGTKLDEIFAPILNDENVAPEVKESIAAYKEWIAQRLQSISVTSEETAASENLSDVLGNLNTATDMLGKARSGDMGITEVLSAVKQLAEESGQSVENFIETVNGKTVLSESGINAWIESLLQSLKELGASDETIARIRTEIDATTEATKKFSDAVSDVSDALQTLSDVHVFNETGNGNQLDMLESIAKMSEGLGGAAEGYSIWDAVTVENGQFKYSEETITNWANKYIEELGLVEGAADDEREALLNLLKLEGFNSNMDKSFGQVDELSDALTKLQAGTLSANEQIELQLKYPRLAGKQDFERALINEMSVIRDDMINFINDQIASLPKGDKMRQAYESMLPLVDEYLANATEENNDKYMSIMQGNAEKLLDMRNKLINGETITPAEQKEFSDLFGIQIDPNDVEASIAAIDAQYDKFINAVHEHYNKLVYEAESFEDKQKLREEERGWIDFLNTLFNFEIDASKTDTFTNALSDLGTATEALGKAKSGDLGIIETWETAQQLAEASGKAAKDFIKTVNGRDVLSESAINQWIEETLASLKELGASDSTLALLRQEIEATTTVTKSLSDAVSDVTSGFQALSTIKMFNVAGSGNPIEILESLAKMSETLGKETHNIWDIASVEDGQFVFDENKTAEWVNEYLAQLGLIEGAAEDSQNAIASYLRLQNLDSSISEGVGKVEELYGALEKIHGEGLPEEEQAALEIQYPELRGAEDFEAAIHEQIDKIRDGMLEYIDEQLANPDMSAEDKKTWSGIRKLVEGYFESAADAADDAYSKTIKDKAHALTDMREKLWNHEEITPEELEAFKVQFPGVEIDPDDVETSVANIEAAYVDIINDVRDIPENIMSAEEKQDLIDYLFGWLDYDTEQQNVERFTGALSDIRTAMDALSKSKAGNLGILDTLEMAQELADASGKTRDHFLEIQGEDLVLNETSINSWIDTTLASLKELGASDETIAKIREEIEETTEAARSFSDAVSDMSTGLQALNDAKVFNKTGNGDPLEMIETLSGLADRLSELNPDKEYNIWDAVGLNDKGDFQFNTDVISEWEADAIASFSDVEGASAGMRDAVLKALRFDGFSESMSTGFSNIDELSEAISNVQTGALTSDQEIQLRLKYSIPAEADLETALLQQVQDERDMLVDFINTQMANAENEEDRQVYANMLPMVDDYVLQSMSEGTDKAIDTMDEQATKLLEMRNKLTSEEELSPEEIEEFGNLFPDVEIDPNDVDKSVANIDKRYAQFFDGIRASYQKQIDEAKTEEQKEALEKQMEEDIAYFQRKYNFSQETEQTIEFTDALTDLGTAADMLSKARSGEMGITDTLNAAMQLAEATGDSVESFLENVDGKTVLSEDAIGKWIENTLAKLQELGASDELIAQLCEEIAETTEVTKELSDAVGDLDSAFKTLADVQTFNATGVGNQLEMLKSLSTLSKDLGAETHNIWDIAKVENGQFTFDETKLAEWVQEYETQMGQVEGAAEDAQAAIVSLVQMENVDANVSEGLGQLDELYDAIEKYRDNKLSDDERMKLEFTYPSLRGAEDFEQAAYAQIDDIENSILSYLNQKNIEALSKGDTAGAEFYSSMYKLARGYFQSAEDATEDAYEETYKDNAKVLTDMYEKLWSGEEIAPEDIDAFHVIFPEVEIDQANLEQSRANVEAAMAGMINDIATIPEQYMSADAKSALTNFLTEFFKVKTEDIKFDALEDVISKVDNASDLIKTADQELADAGENTTDTLSSVMDMFGQDWAKYVDFGEMGEIKINTDKIRQSMYDAIDAVADADLPPEYKEKLKLKLDWELDTENFEESINTYVDDMGTLQEALTKMGSGEFSAEDKFNLIMQFPKLRANIDNLDEGIANLMSDMDSDIMASFAEQLANADTEEARQEIYALMDAVRELKRETVGSKITIDIEAEKTSMESFMTALEESNGATGLSAESMEAIDKRFRKIKGYKMGKVFERTASGIKLNTKEALRLNEAYKEQQKQRINEDLAALTDEYNSLTQQINEAGSSAEAANLYARRNEVLEQINDIAALSAEYTGLTSAFNEWKEAQETPDSGANYDWVRENLDSLNELYENGEVGKDDFRKGLEYLTGKDETFASASELIEDYENIVPKTERYMTEDDTGVLNFLQDVHEAGEAIGEDWAHINENGDWVLNGNTQEIADAMGMGVEWVEDIIRKMPDFGGWADFDDPIKDLGLIEDKAQSAGEKLAELGKTDFEFNLSSRSVSDLTTQIEEAQGLVEELSATDENGEIIDPEGLYLAQYLLRGLIAEKQALTQPAIMSIDTSGMDADMAYAVGQMQQFVTLSNQLEMEVRQGEDTSATLASLQECAATINGLDEDVKVNLGLDDTTFNEAYEALAGKDPVELSATVDMEQVTAFQTTFNSITDKSIAINTNSDAVNGQLQEINEFTIDNKSFTVTVLDAASSLLNSIKSKLASIQSKTITVTTNYVSKGQQGPKYNGTANAYGTAVGAAFSSGDWGTKDAGTALVGELGRRFLRHHTAMYVI